jgi:hypothetical protein
MSSNLISDEPEDNKETKIDIGYVDMKKMDMISNIIDPSPIAFLNVYAKGDKWIKIKGCEGCLEENVFKCCGNCPMLLLGKEKRGCSFHFEVNRTSKPYYCIISPNPSVCKKYCQQKWECVEHPDLKMIGKIRRISKPGNIVDDA